MLGLRHSLNHPRHTRGLTVYGFFPQSLCPFRLSPFGALPSRFSPRSFAPTGLALAEHGHPWLHTVIGYICRFSQHRDCAPAAWLPRGTSYLRAQTCFVPGTELHALTAPEASPPGFIYRVLPTWTFKIHSSALAGLIPQGFHRHELDHHKGCPEKHGHPRG
jgi:hypothetical protein